MARVAGALALSALLVKAANADACAGAQCLAESEDASLLQARSVKYNISQHRGTACSGVANCDGHPEGCRSSNCVNGDKCCIVGTNCEYCGEGCPMSNCNAPTPTPPTPTPPPSPTPPTPAPPTPPSPGSCNSRMCDPSDATPQYCPNPHGAEVKCPSSGCCDDAGSPPELAQVASK